MLPSTSKSSAERGVRKSRDPKWYSLFEYPPKTVDLGKLDPRMAGATVLATLAYPEKASSESLFRTALRLSGRAAYNQLTTAERWFPSSLVGGVGLPVDEKMLGGGDKSFSRRIRKRVQAGYIALEPIVMHERGEICPHNWGGRWNRSAAFRKAADEIGIDDIANFTNRYWYTSLAVIHVAAAFTIQLKVERNAGLPISPTERVITDRAYLAEILVTAERLELVVAACNLAIPSDRLIKFRVE
jgi:hypothetical protein